MEHEIYLTLVEHNDRIKQLEDKIAGIVKAIGLKEKEQPNEPK